MLMNSSVAMWSDAPVPPEANVSLPGLDFASAMYSFTDFTGRAGCTHSTFSAWPTGVIGARSFSGSNDMRAYMWGLIATCPEVAITSV